MGCRWRCPPQMVSGWHHLPWMMSSTRSVMENMFYLFEVWGASDQSRKLVWFLWHLATFCLGTGHVRGVWMMYWQRACDNRCSFQAKQVTQSTTDDVWMSYGQHMDDVRMTYVIHEQFQPKTQSTTSSIQHLYIFCTPLQQAIQSRIGYPVLSI